MDWIEVNLIDLYPKLRLTKTMNIKDSPQSISHRSILTEYLPSFVLLSFFFSIYTVLVFSGIYTPPQLVGGPGSQQNRAVASPHSLHESLGR